MKDGTYVYLWLIHVDIWQKPTQCWQLSSNWKKKKTCSTAFRLCGTSFLQSWSPGPLSLTAGLVARIWCFQHRVPASVSGWEPKPRSKPLQAEVIQDQCDPTEQGLLTKGTSPRLSDTCIFTKWEDALKTHRCWQPGSLFWAVCITLHCRTRELRAAACLWRPGSSGYPLEQE